MGSEHQPRGESFVQSDDMILKTVGGIGRPAHNREMIDIIII